MSAESIDRVLTSYRESMAAMYAAEQVEWLAFGYWQGRLEGEELYTNGNKFAQYVKVWWGAQGAKLGLSHVSANLRALYAEWRASQL